MSALFSRRGRTGRFSDEACEYVATIEVRISVRDVRDTQRAVEVITERAVAAAAGTYDWHAARVVTADLVSVARSTHTEREER